MEDIRQNLGFGKRNSPTPNLENPKSLAPNRSSAVMLEAFPAQASSVPAEALFLS